MIVETALLLGGALFTAVVGAPIVGRITGNNRWKQYAPRDPSTARTAQESRKAFEPLDLGPDLMMWPSEVQRPEHGRAEPKWPSQTWDDPHFGARWKQNRPEMSTASEDAWQARQDTRRSDLHQQRESERHDTAEAQQRRAAWEQDQQRLHNAAPQSREQVRVARHEAKAAPAPRDVPAAGTSAADAIRAHAQRAIDRTAEAVGAGSNAPAAEELERLVATVGLAGTVQEIMNRTGWDFRQAAHHLARTRSSGH